ncbi:MAG: cyclic nucleotide-binding/CBS domain-containing protein [Dehalococcoidia bacterium]
MAHLTDLMIRDLITVPASSSIAEAARCMAENRVGAVLVMEGETLVGILSERDLVARVIAARVDPARGTAGHVASTGVVTVESSAPFREVLRVFRAGRFRHLPVVENGKPVGILSTRDFLAFLVDGFESLIDDAAYRDKLATGADPYDHIGGGYEV